MSNLSDFLSENNIKPEALVTLSHALEQFSPDERSQMAKRSEARRNKKTYAELSLEKVKSRGRGISSGTLHRAMEGQPVPRLVRQKILRAVNASLLSQKKSEVD